MDNITTLLHEIIFGLCLLALIPCAANAMRSRVLLAFSALLCIIAAWALATLPMFYFVDGFGRLGTGLCVDGRQLEAVRWEIIGRQVLIEIVCLLLPLVLGAGSLYQFRQKRLRQSGN